MFVLKLSGIQTKIKRITGETFLRDKINITFLERSTLKFYHLYAGCLFTYNGLELDRFGQKYIFFIFKYVYFISQNQPSFIINYHFNFNLI